MNELNYNDGIPEDKDRLCVFYDGDYYIDTFNNLSSSGQKQLLRWAYLPLIDNSQTEKVNNESDKEITVWPESFSNSPSGCYITCKTGNGTPKKSACGWDCKTCKKEFCSLIQAGSCEASKLVTSNNLVIQVTSPCLQAVGS